MVYDPITPGHTFTPPKFHYYKNLRKLFETYSYQSLFPHQPKLTTNGNAGPDNYASSGYVLTNGADLHMYLVPSENYQINVVLQEPVNGQLKATWYNPYTGEFREEGTSQRWNWKAYQSPWKEKLSVLIIKSERCAKRVLNSFNLEGINTFNTLNRPKENLDEIN